MPQQGASRNQDIPDYLLFQDAQAKNRAISREKTEERYLDASAVLENKRFGLRLESRDPNDKVNTSSPHGQILRYLSVGNVLPFYPNFRSLSKIPSSKMGEFYPNQFIHEINASRIPGKEKSGPNTAPIIPDQRITSGEENCKTIAEVEEQESWLREGMKSFRNS